MVTSSPGGLSTIPENNKNLKKNKESLRTGIPIDPLKKVFSLEFEAEYMGFRFRLREIVKRLLSEIRSDHLELMSDATARARMHLGREFTARTGIPHADAVNNHLSIRRDLRPCDVYCDATGEYLMPRCIVRDEPLDFDLVRACLIQPLEARIRYSVDREFQVWRWYCAEKEECRRTINAGLRPMMPMAPDTDTLRTRMNARWYLPSSAKAIFTPMSPLVREQYRRNTSELRKALHYIHSEVNDLIKANRITAQNGNYALIQVYSEFRRSKASIMISTLGKIHWKGARPDDDKENEHDFSWSYASASLFHQLCVKEHLTPRGILITKKPGEY